MLVGACHLPCFTDQHVSFEDVTPRESPTTERTSVALNLQVYSHVVGFVVRFLLMTIELSRTNGACCHWLAI